MEELFEDRLQLAIPDLPNRLEVLSEKLQHFQVESMDVWIKKHTFFHYYTNFALPETKKFVYETMSSGLHKKATHMVTGVMASEVKDNHYMRFCPKCVKADIEQYGETFWRLSQQLPSAQICLKHRCLLLDSDVPFRPKNRHEYVMATRDNCQTNQQDIVLTPRVEEHLYFLGLESMKLASNDYYFSWDTLQKAYRYLLQSKGYANAKGRVDQQALARQFQLFYGKEVLDRMQSRVDEDNPSCWLKAITRKHRKAFHPVRHLLFIRFLGATIDTILSYSCKELLPFGKPLYPCLNKVCEGYKKDVIPDVLIHICTDTKKPVGTFLCPKCGFSYSRRGPDMNEKDRFKIGRIKSFGDHWFKRLDKLIRGDKASFRLAARELGVDTKTVIKYAQKVEKTCDSLNISIVVEKDKKEWMELCNNADSFTITDIRRKNPALYARLYRSSQEWLLSNSPKGKPVLRKQVIDWTERDLEILKQVKLAADIIKKHVPPLRLTVSRIGTEIGKRNLLEKRLDRLPITKSYLDTVIETIEEFQIRRIHYWAKQLKKDGDLTDWKLKRLAGLKEDITSKVQEEIDSIILNAEVGE